MSSSPSRSGGPDPAVLGAQLYKVILLTSATARGQEVSKNVAGKPRLELTRAKLIAQVRRNTFRVAEIIAQAIREQWPTDRVIDAIVQATHEGFPKSVMGWRTHATHRRRETGQRYGLRPGRIQKEVKCFKRILARTINGPDPVRRAAWAEWEWDHRIHPLADGCGRTAKGISTWVLALHRIPPPNHASKREYNSAMNAGFPGFLWYYRRRIREAAGIRGPRRASREPPSRSPKATLTSPASLRKAAC